jgi:chromosome segregation protein
LFFNRLGLAGFKSFVDASELYIEPGLTGIVGPNGCGKSNVVEALGWVMGENSPKRMRGGEMDDVIFSGTTARPPRNIAEVTLRLDNAERRAPALFNDWDELEVTRRIERGSGSVYRVNGREVRARDVQLLFADAASGAHSTALVNQGRIGEVIRAKPADRRALLEEAAGITGLHSRRHEAELRLRAAETNLERLDDVMAALESQLQGLKRQARQATRYRNISRDLRRAEALLLHLRWTESQAGAEAAARQLDANEAEVAELTRRAATATTAQTEAAERLPELRQAEAEAAARLHRLALARDGLDAEERRLQEDRQRLEAELARLEDDDRREQDHAADAAEATTRLDAERRELEAAQEGEEAAGAAAAERLGEAREVLAAREAELDELTSRIAAATARRESLGQQIEALTRRIARLDERTDEIVGEARTLAAEGGEDAALAAAETAVESARDAAALARTVAEEAERDRADALAAEAQAREAMQRAETEATRLRAEVETLVKLLAIDEDELWPPLIDALTVEAGYEEALGAALGDDLAMPTDEAAPAHWKSLELYGSPPPLPAGAKPLADVVAAPPALARRLSQIGVVADKNGARLAADLAQGQRLVSRSGGLWRWDGFTVAAGAPTSAATRLAQRNRLTGLRDELRAYEATAAQVREGFDAAHATAEVATARENAARAALSEAGDAVRLAGEALAEAMRASAGRRSRCAALDEASAGIAADRGEAERQRQEAETALEAVPAVDAAREAVLTLRDEVGDLRTALAEARSAHDRLAAEARARAGRLEALAGETATWQRRAESASAQLDQLAARRATATESLAALADKPAEIAERRAALEQQLAEAEAERRGAATSLAEAENTLAERDRAAKAAQEALGAGREERVRAEAATQQSNERLTELAGRIREALDCAPEQALEAAEVKDPENLPALDWVEARLERLKRERDNMGPVNLRAEVEVAEIGEQLETMRSERTDLEAAIGRLRQGISSLNREGRERLLAAFGQVDEHFRELFTRLFGGGRAQLALTDSEDPLEAGLEIMASPAGKRLQTISLLSGGEQALTALSLLFAVFLTNPAPICVLDEVDAPLDDNNAARFCDLVDDITRSTGTRFLVVTHNPITMARMDRLYGVTMSELGVSQLVSVDLAGAEGLRAVS